MSRLSFLFILPFTYLLSQHSDTYSEKVMRGFLTGNNISISFYNDGAISGFNDDINIRGIWKGNEYINDMTPTIGIELPIKDYTNDGIDDTLHTVIISRGLRNGQSLFPNGHPIFNYYWGYNPIPGFRNINFDEPALSSNENTWPAFWPDHPEYGNNVWNGLFGPDSFIGGKQGGQEAYFVMDDFWDTKTNYYYEFLADSSDPEFTGHGIVVSVRYIQLNNPLFEDVIFRIYDIKNISKHTYSKMFFGTVTGNLSGGDGDSEDDLSEFDPLTNTVLSWDYDGIGNEGQKIGVLGESVIQSPAGNKITNFNCFKITSSPDMSNDELLWDKMIPGKFDKQPPIPQNGDYLYGTGYFSLNPEETKRVVSLIALGDTKDDVRTKVNLAEALLYNNFNIEQMLSQIKITNYGYHKTLRETQEINWQTAQKDGTVDLWFSPDAGKSWKIIDTSVHNTGLYSWNTEQAEDCAFGILRVYLKNNEQNIIGYHESSLFTIDNDGDGTPFIKITSPIFRKDTLVTDKILDFSILTGDPETSDLNLKILFSNDGGNNYNLLNSINVKSDTSTQNISVNIYNAVNSINSVIKLEVNDGINYHSDSTELFSKQNERDQVSSNYIERLTGFSIVPVQVNKIIETEITGDEYLLTFDDTSSADKSVSAYNITKAVNVFDKIPFPAATESPIFDGINFIAYDEITRLDSSKTKWNEDTQTKFNIGLKVFSQGSVTGYNQPNDYRIIFSNAVADTSVDIRSFGATGNAWSAKPINFEVYNVQSGKKVKVGYAKSGSITTSLIIVFIENIFGKESLTWNSTLTYPQPNVFPANGDTVYLYTIKGLSVYDSIKIKSIPVSVEDKPYTPGEYYLSNNYPNPFNPATKIKFSIPNREIVTIKIFDILGREVLVLLNEEKPAGEYEVVFSAMNVPTGVYLYQLTAGSYQQTRKMLLLK